MSKTPRGRFITLEGGEGAGKSTNLRVIEDALKHAGVSFLTSREPGGTELAETLRRLLLDPATEIMPLSELLVVFAARFDHVERVIVPALRSGTWVVCDRFVDASYAYQGGGRGLAWQKIQTLERWLPRLARPDLTLLLDVAPGRGLARATRNRKADRFEQERAEFYQRVRQAYLRRASAGDRYQVIDAGRGKRAVARDVRATIQGLLQRHGYEGRLGGGKK